MMNPKIVFLNILQKLKKDGAGGDFYCGRLTQGWAFAPSTPASGLAANRGPFQESSIKLDGEIQLMR